MDKVNLSEKFTLFNDHWKPRIAGELNGQHVKLVKFVGAFDGTITTTKTSYSWLFRAASRWSSSTARSSYRRASS